MGQVLWPSGRLRWIAAASVLLLFMSAVITSLLPSSGQPASSRAKPAVFASPSPPSVAVGQLDSAQGVVAAAAPAVAPAAAPAAAPAVAPAAAPAAAPNAASAAGSEFDCTVSDAVCYSTGRNGQGHRYAYGGTACLGGTTVETIINNTAGRIAYAYADGHCDGTPLATVDSGNTRSDLPSIALGNQIPHSILIVDPAGAGRVSSCDDAVCVWPLAGYSGAIATYGITNSQCYNTEDGSGNQRWFSMADTTSDLVAYLYATAACAGPPAVVAPGEAFGNLGGGDSFGSIQVIRLAPGTGIVGPPLTTALVTGPGGPSLYALFDDLTSCEGAVAPVTAACFLFADGTVEGQVDPVGTASSVLNDLLPGSTEQLAPLDDGTCSIVPHMGSSDQIVEAVNQSGNPMILGPGSCDDLTGADAANATAYSIATGLTAIVGPTVAAVAYETATPALSPASLVSLGAPRLLDGPSAINGLGFSHLGDMPTVVSAIQGTPADGAGLAKGDQVVAVNGEQVVNFADYLAYIGQLGSNAPWSLTLVEPDTQDIVSVNLAPSPTPVGGGVSVSASTWTTYPDMGACKADTDNTGCYGLQDGQAIGLVNALAAEDQTNEVRGLFTDDEDALAAPEGPANPVVEVWNNTDDDAFVAAGTSLAADGADGSPIYDIPAGADIDVPAVDADSAAQSSYLRPIGGTCGNNLDLGGICFVQPATNTQKQAEPAGPPGKPPYPRPIGGTCGNDLDLGGICFPRSATKAQPAKPAGPPGKPAYPRPPGRTCGNDLDLSGICIPR